MAATMKNELIFGIKYPLPLSGFPQGRIKIKMRNSDFAWAYVKNDSGIRKFAIAEKDGNWIPMYEQGSNYRPE